MKKIEQYVESLFKDIPDSERKAELMEEIIQNLDEKVADLVAEGKAEEDAVNKAIVEFGDITDIKQELVTAKSDVRVRNAALNLGFSACGSLLIILLCIFINFYYTPQVYWFLYPTFAVLWWPLAMFFWWMKLRGREENEKS